MNQIFISGNLVHNPKKHESSGGKTFYSATLANNYSYLDSNQNEVNHVSYFDLVIGKTGHFKYLEKYGKKGSQAVIQGRVELGAYEKDGVKHRTIRIIVQDLKLSLPVTSAYSVPSPQNTTADETPFD